MSEQSLEPRFLHSKHMVMLSFQTCSKEDIRDGAFIRSQHGKVQTCTSTEVQMTCSHKPPDGASAAAWSNSERFCVTCSLSGLCLE